MPIEFEELENKYTNSVSKYKTLKRHAKEILEKDALLKSYEAQLESYSEESLSAVSSLLSEAQLHEIEQKREELLGKVEALKNDTLLKKKDELTEAKTEMDEYIKQAETRPEFREAVYNGIMEKAITDIEHYEELKKYPKSSMDLISKLQEKAKTDKSLAKTLGFIDQDKSDIATYKATIELMKSSKENTDLVEQSLNKKIGLLGKSGTRLKGYLTAHKDELGLTDDDLDFSNPSSKAFFVNDYISPDNSTSLDAYKNDYQVQVDDIDKKIKHHRKIYEYAKTDLEELKSPEQEEVEVKAWRQILQGIANLFKRCTNYINTGKFELPGSTPKVQVINSTGDWKDSYKTKIGKAKMDEIRKNYETRIKNAERHHSDPSGR